MDKEEISFLHELIEAIEEASAKLEIADQKSESKNFNKARSFIFKVQKKIDEVTRWAVIVIYL